MLVLSVMNWSAKNIKKYDDLILVSRTAQQQILERKIENLSKTDEVMVKIWF